MRDSEAQVRRFVWSPFDDMEIIELYDLPQDMSKPQLNEYPVTRDGKARTSSLQEIYVICSKSDNSPLSC